jgi:hypothetical protein
MDFSDVKWLEVDGLKVRYLKGPERTGVPLFLNVAPEISTVPPSAQARLSCFDQTARGSIRYI